MATKNAVREYITVDGEEKLVTKVVMMEYALDALVATNANPTIVRKAEATLEQLRKTAAKPKGTSPEARFNEAKAKEILAKMDTDREYTLNDIMNLTTGLISTNKTTQAMRILVRDGKVEKVAKRSPMKYKKISD